MEANDGSANQVERVTSHLFRDTLADYEGIIESSIISIEPYEFTSFPRIRDENIEK